MLNFKMVLRTVFIVLGLAVVAGCTNMYRNHGYAPSDADMSEIAIGVDTRETVAAKIGPPTAGGVNGDFFYVQSRFREYAFTRPQEIDRTVVAVSFNPAGTVRNIERFGLEEGRIVRLSRRVTDDGINDVSFLGQLFGSIGNFDAGAVFADQ